MSKKDKKNRNKAQNSSQKNDEAPVVTRTPRTKETIRNVEVMNQQREKDFQLLRELLENTNGEFPKEERKLIDCYIFRDLSEEKSIEELGVSPEKFWRTFDSAAKKIRDALPRIMIF